MLNEFFFLALTLGLSAGFAPGPLTNLIIQESLSHGIKSGIKVALTPLIVDTPIILFIIFLASYFKDSIWFFSLVSIIGGLFLFYLAYKNTKSMNFEIKEGKKQSFKDGIIVGFLNPNAYLFWFSIGTPILFKSLNISYLYTVVFIFFFYFLLVSSKIAIAVIVGKSRALLNGIGFKIVSIILTALLFFYGVDLLIEGFKGIL